ncbi:uncharacterized protein KZ484_019837 [Pholidichthys leucotaenia]
MPQSMEEAEKIVLKPKGMEEKTKRPFMPEATVRLLINYNKSHKTVVRVNPKLPLELLLPAVCDKCEFDVETTILLKDYQSEEPLDLTKTLNDHGLRELHAKDTAAKHLDCQRQLRTSESAITPTEVISSPRIQELPKKEKKRKENKGFFSLFRRRKKKHELEGPVSAPASPGLTKHVRVSENSEDISSSNTLPADRSKKRRAPQPPMSASLSIPNNLSTCHLGGIQRSAQPTLKSTKRRAPPPPSANTLPEQPTNTSGKETVNSLKTVEELNESEDLDSIKLLQSSSVSPQPQSSSSRPSLGHLQEVADPLLPSLRGIDLSDARCALAKVLMSSVSKGTLVKRLKNSTTFPKFHNCSSSVPMNPRCSDNDVFCPELESVVMSGLPTENEWEDPAQRQGLTTFKVVPVKKQTTEEEPTQHDPNKSQMLEDDPKREALPEDEEEPQSPDASEAEEHENISEPTFEQFQVSPPSLCDADSRSPHTPPSEFGDAMEKQTREVEPEGTDEVMPVVCSDDEFTPESSDHHWESNQNPTAVTDQCDSCPDERKVEEDMVEEEHEEEEEDVEDDKEESSFPPPPPPVFFNQDAEVAQEERDDPTCSSVLSSTPQSPTTNGLASALSEAPREELTLTKPELSLNRKSSAPSRFAQAVAMAVQRSCRGKGSDPQLSSGQHDGLPSPPRSTYQYAA